MASRGLTAAAVTLGGNSSDPELKLPKEFVEDRTISEADGASERRENESRKSQLKKTSNKVANHQDMEVPQKVLQRDEEGPDGDTEGSSGTSSSHKAYRRKSGKKSRKSKVVRGPSGQKLGRAARNVVTLLPREKGQGLINLMLRVLTMSSIRDLEASKTVYKHQTNVAIDMRASRFLTPGMINGSFVRSVYLRTRLSPRVQNQVLAAGLLVRLTS